MQQDLQSSISMPVKRSEITKNCRLCYREKTQFSMVIETKFK